MQLLTQVAFLGRTRHLSRYFHVYKGPYLLSFSPIHVSRLYGKLQHHQVNPVVLWRPQKPCQKCSKSHSTASLPHHHPTCKPRKLTIPQSLTFLRTSLRRSLLKATRLSPRPILRPVKTLQCAIQARPGRHLAQYATLAVPLLLNKEHISAPPCTISMLV